MSRSGKQWRYFVVISSVHDPLLITDRANPTYKTNFRQPMR